MAEKTLTLEIVTPEKKIISEVVTSFVVPAIKGSMGVLYNHAPIISELEIGEIRYKGKDKEGRIALSSTGFLELSDNKATILATTAEICTEIDCERALAAKERALKRIQSNETDVDFVRAEQALKRAVTRLKVANK